MVNSKFRLYQDIYFKEYESIDGSPVLPSIKFGMVKGFTDYSIVVELEDETELHLSEDELYATEMECLMSAYDEFEFVLKELEEIIKEKSGVWKLELN